MRRRMYRDKKLSDFICSYLALTLMLLNVIPLQYSQAIAAGAPDEKPADADEPKSELSFSVKESQAPIEKGEKLPAAPAADLPAQRVLELLKRLSPLEKVEKKAFVIPEDSLVKPKIPGIQTLETFPPKDTTPREKPVVDESKTPLAVMRVSHSGVVDEVTQYAMTFSQPMVPISEAAAHDTITAVQMQPQPAGKYKWAGTQTVLFEPQRGRFPKSTEYTITVPAGTQSTTGSKAAKPMSWTMTTPTVTVKNFYPQGGPQVQSPIMVAIFDQDIDRDAIFKMIKVSAGKETFSLRKVDDETVEKDATRKYLVANLPKNQWLAFQASNPLPLGTSVKVSFPAGLPSAEGPLKTAKAQDFNVDIHGAFKLVKSPEQGVSAERWAYRPFLFSNPIDNSKGKFDEKMIKITPEVKDAEWQVGGTQMWLRGRLKPFTKYTVTFDKDIVDTFGQTLGRDVVSSFTTGALNTQLRQMDAMNTIPFGQKPIVTMYAQAVPQVKVTVFKVTPSDWKSFSSNHYNHDFTVGTQVGSKTFKVGDEDVQFDVDLSPYLKNGFGQLVLRAETIGAPKNYNQHFSSWVQVTKLGVDAFRGRNLIGLVTTLSDGAPVAGAEMSVLESNNSTVSDSNGLGKISITDNWEKSILLMAKKGDDVAFVPASQYHSGWSYSQRQPELKWYTVTDRQLYKPGEKVTVRGWTRGLRFTQNDALQLVPSHVDSITYQINGYDGTELVKGNAKVDATGAFTFEAKIPEKINLGNANLQITAKSEGNFKFSANEPATSMTSYFNSGTQTAYVELKIQEFRRPEFEMKVSSSLGTSMLLGDTTSLTAKTQYYAGGALTDAPINWSIAASQTQYSPPGWSEFSFGHGSPFWIRPMMDYHRGGRGIFPPGGMHPLETKIVNGKTNAAGTNTVDLKFDTFKEPLPMSASCEATVYDVNRQSWSDKVSVLVHPADTYIGVKPGRWFYRKGEAVDLRVIATDLDGKAKAGSKAILKLVRVDKDGKEVEVTRQNISSSDHPQLITMMPKQGGQHYVVATVFDGKDRRNLTKVSTWIEGDTPAEARKAQLENLIVIPDKKEYQPGDTAEILVSSPFYPAHGIVTVRRDTIVSTIPLDMDSSSKTVKIPIIKDYYPNLTVDMYVAGKNSAFASGNVELKVPPRARTLSLKAVAAQPEISPGGDTTIDIELKNAEGKPVKDGQVTLVVVDESILALAGYKWPDPMEIFYPEAQISVETAYFRQYVIKAVQEMAQDEMERRKAGGAVPAAPPPSPLMMKSAAMGRAGGGGIGLVEGPRDTNLFQVEPQVMDARAYSTGRAMCAEAAMAPGSVPMEENKPITVRSNFDALALYVPFITTDENGKAQAKLHLPDSLTRYRIMAAAIAGDDAFGSTESNVTARLPLMVKPSAPRFLHFGDRCELPVVLQNQTDKPLKVEVVLRADNAKLTNVGAKRDFESTPESTVEENNSSGNNKAKDETGDSPDSSTRKEPASSTSTEFAGKIVDVPANDRVEVRFPVATIDEGKANFQVAAVSGSATDAADFSIPILVPATKESFAAYGQIDKGAILQKLDRPKDVYEQVGGLSISTSSTAVQALTDAYFYLKNYTFGCSEQLSSRMIAMLALQDVLVSFGKLDGAALTEFKNFVNKDIEELVKRQNSDGSFGLWKLGEQTQWPYVSIQVAQALNLASEKDFKVDAAVLNKSRNYLKNIAQHIPKEYSERTKISIEARALNVRYRMKDVDASAARRLIHRALKPQSNPKDKNPPIDPPIPLAKMSSEKISSDLSLETAGWLLPVISHDSDSASEIAMIRKLFDASIKETASTASANDGGYGGWGYCIFYSPRRTDAIVLEALMEDQPKSELIPKMVKGLLAHRKNGTWEGTQENGYILQALDRYFNTYENQTPNFESQEWLGDTLVGLQKFAGRTTETKTLELPMSFLAKRNDSEVVINKVGPGRLYYRIGLDYAPKNLVLKPADFGFAVERTYEAVDDESEVKRDADGVWHFKSGATVRVKLKFSTPGARYHVAMMDPLAAGTEPLNPDLSGSRTQVPPNATTTKPSGGPRSRGKIAPIIDSFIWWWPMTWFEHQNLRDHQAEAFQSLLFAGKYDYTYLVRATTPGDYIVPPTKVEEMYMSETFGRSASDHVIVE